MDRDNEAAIANTHFRQTLLAIRRVLGETGAKDIYRSVNLDVHLATLPPDDLNHNFAAQDYARIMQAIETTYGQRGARILERIGRESFHIILREQATLMSAANKVMSLWSTKQRIHFMMQTIVDTQHKTYPQAEIWLEEKDGQLAYIEQNCLICHERQASHSICYLTTGFIDEALQWATGKEIEVTEIECSAMGNAYCRFEIGKKVPYRSST